jgi:hypothetical protein
MAIEAKPFLSGAQFRPIHLNAPAGYAARGLALGRGNPALEVVAFTTTAPPRADDLRQLWKARHAGRAAPVVVAAAHGSKVAVCGPLGDPPAFYSDLDIGQAERVLSEALSTPDRHAALRLLRDVLPSAAGELPGLRNEGLLATHELRVAVKTHAAYPGAATKARTAVGKQDRELLEGLGYRIERLDNATSILRGGDQKRLGLAVLLQQHEAPEIPSERFSQLTPLSYALSVADREGVPFVLVCQGPKIRLYPARVGVGVGQRSRTETFIEAHTTVLRDDDLGYLWMLFSADALSPGGTFEHLLAESERFAGSLAEDLRERIYAKVIPNLATAIARARQLRRPKASDLRATYDMAMLALFRLLFIAYAEDKDLLPYRWNETYKHRSLKTKSRELMQDKLAAVDYGSEPALWQEIQLLFNAVADGNKSWGVPAYNGGLFTADAEVSPAGDALGEVSLPNADFAPVLADLLLAPSPEGLGPVDFRSLGVREFGTVYEGLLESELAIADADLGLDEQNHYRPSRKGEQPVIRKGDIYLHDRSGARKATGSYFTKGFAVEYLLDHTLEPALAEHLKRLDAIRDDDAAAEALFDFRVADIAMGSGHFLVAAIDRIERALAGYLARRVLPGVRAEMAELRQAAVNSLGALADEIEIEDTQLLRRLVARRCIYGVDLNPTSVQLARLAVWVHTFVPGLPLSFLDHNLVVGNSLVGIADFKEVEEALVQSDIPMFRADPTELLQAAAKPLARLARLSDATLADVQRAKKLEAELKQAVKPVAVLCDMVTAARVRGDGLSVDLAESRLDLDSLFGSRDLARLRKDIDRLRPFHFPIAFPEVFLRQRRGFDVILGNPPWEEATLERHAFWARHFPGLRALRPREREAELAKLEEERPDLLKQYEAELADAQATRDALMSGGYAGMGTGDPDLYKGFTWRFLTLAAAEGGRIGVVLPRSAMNAKGSEDFRKTLFKTARTLDVCMLLNSGRWLFDMEPRYTVGLVAIEKRPTGTEADVLLRGPFPSLARFNAGATKPPYVLKAADVQAWTDSASLPLLPSEQSMEVFVQLRKAPRLDLNQPGQWRVRPHRELDATNDRALMDLESEDCPKGFWPVFTGESFDLWTPDTGSYFGWADPDELVPYLFQKRQRGGRLASSPFSEFDRRALQDKRTLPCMNPRIAFRDVTNRTNRRTTVVALLPPKVFLTNKAPYLLWPRGDEQDQAFLLGVLSSIPLDWYARRFVETNMNFFIFNPLPVPRPPRTSRLWQRCVAVAGRLASPDRRFAAWARAVGVDCGPLDDGEKYDAIAELDAVVAHLYGLSEAQLVHVFETFHEGWDFASRLKAVLKHFHAWSRRT